MAAVIDIPSVELFYFMVYGINGQSIYGVDLVFKVANSTAINISNADK
jgi:hypothetical protein